MHHSIYDLIAPRPLRELTREIHDTLDDLTDRVSPEMSRQQAFLIGLEKQLLELRDDVDDFPELARTIKVMLRRF